MKRNELDLFINDKFRILQVLKDTEQEIDGKRFSPVLYEEIASKLHLSRQTIAKYIDILKSNGYVKTLMKGRIQLTEKGTKILEELERE